MNRSVRTQHLSEADPSDGTRPMDVALVTSMKHGLTQFIYRDIEALVDKGHRVELFSLLRAPGLIEPRPDWNVRVASRGKALTSYLRLLVSRPSQALELTRHAMKFGTLKELGIAAQWHRHVADFELIFAYFGDHKLFVSYYLKRLTGLPLTVTVRAYELYHNPNWPMFKESLAACDRVLTITEYNHKRLVEHGGVSPDKITIIRQIVDLELYKYQPKQVILSVGFFAEKKGFDTLLQAFSMLERDDVELWIVGDGNPSVLEVDPRALAQDLGIEDRVAFFGAQSGPALRALYRECDVFCLASHTDSFGNKEGFPNVIAEAMAFSKPIVSTRHAGIPEAIDEILVEEHAADDLADALNAVLDSKELRDRLGDRNRARALEMFSPRNNDRLEEALAEAIAPDMSGTRET